ncbi:hypothetical protein SKB0120_12580 [Moraxella osloensis]
MNLPNFQQLLPHKLLPHKLLSHRIDPMSQQPLVKILLQITLIGVVWGTADILKKLFNIPMSSGIVGLFLMLGLLLTGVIKLAWVNVGAKFILGELVLLFIPLMMSITQYQQLFFAKGWQLMITIVVSTVLVMLSSAVTFMLGNRVKRAWYRRTHHTHQ